MAAQENAWQRFNKGTHAGFESEATAPDLESGGAPETLEMPNGSRVGFPAFEAATAKTNTGPLSLRGGQRIDL